MKILWHSRDSKLVQIQYTCIFSAPSHHHHNPPKPIATKILQAISIANGCTVFNLHYGREIRNVGLAVAKMTYCDVSSVLSTISAVHRSVSFTPCPSAAHRQCPCRLLRAPVLPTASVRSVSSVLQCCPPSVSAPFSRAPVLSTVTLGYKECGICAFNVNAALH